jgi:hypothetical protein
MWLKELFFELEDDHCTTNASDFNDKKEECVLQNIQNPRQNDEESALPHVQERQQSVTVKSTYLPFYIVGNLLLCKLYFLCNDARFKQITALSSFSAGAGLYDLSHLFVVSNSVVQMFLLYILGGDVRNSVITPANFLTHLVMKTNIGLNVLFVWRTWSILNVRVSQLFAFCVYSLLPRRKWKNPLSTKWWPYRQLSSLLYVPFGVLFLND